MQKQATIWPKKNSRDKCMIGYVGSKISFSRQILCYSLPIKFSPYEVINLSFLKKIKKKLSFD